MKIIKYAINDYPVITIYQIKNKIKNYSLKIKNT